MSEEAKDDVRQVTVERLQRSHGRLIRVVSVFPQQGSATPEDKLMLDLMYIEHYSFMLDCKLILMTVATMFKKESTEGFDKQIEAAEKAAESTEAKQIAS